MRTLKPPTLATLSTGNCCGLRPAFPYGAQEGWCQLPESPPTPHGRIQKRGNKRSSLSSLLTTQPMSAHRLQTPEGGYMSTGHETERVTASCSLCHVAWGPLGSKAHWEHTSRAPSPGCHDQGQSSQLSSLHPRFDSAR